MATRNREDLRNETRQRLRDWKRYASNTKTGDSSTTVYKLKRENIVTGSYYVYVNSVLKTETTDYTIDKDQGVVIFVVAPGAVTVQIDYRYTIWSDERLNNYYRQAVRELWPLHYNEFVDTSLSTSTTTRSYDLSSITNIEDIVSVEIANADGDFDTGDDTKPRKDWVLKNNRQTLVFNSLFGYADRTIRIRGIKRWQPFSNDSIAGDFPEELEEAVMKKVEALCWEDRYKSRAEYDRHKVTILPNGVRISELQNLATDTIQKYDQMIENERLPLPPGYTNLNDF